jgi:hypothetical protein
VRQFVGFLGLVVMESFLQSIALARVPKGNVRWGGESSGVVNFTAANVRFAETIH